MIIYFSGTGNSLQIARDLADKTNDIAVSILHLTNDLQLREKAHECNNKLISGEEEYSKELVKTEKIGFVLPVYNYDIPLFIKEILEFINFPSASYFYIVVCHGGDKGNAVFSLKAILEQKGCSLTYASDIKMPTNSRIMYGMVTDQIEKRISASKVGIEKIANDINARNINVRQVRENKFLTFMARFVNRESIQKRFTPVIDNVICINCGICLKVCPVKNIQIKGDFPFVYENCVQCMTCMHWCPQTAIHFEKRRVKKKQQYHHPEFKWTDIK